MGGFRDCGTRQKMIIYRHEKRYEVGDRMMETVIQIDTKGVRELSPYVFGHNLEHTRAAVNGGLSAQMLRNRKFAGKPARNCGFAAEWKGVGDRAFFQLLWEEAYTRHIGCEKMFRRNEMQSQSVQNVHGGLCGISQDGLVIRAGTAYELRAVTKCSAPETLAAELTDREGETVYARQELNLCPGDWQTSSFTLKPTKDDDESVIHFVFSERAEVLFGAVSMLPEGHFHGMRQDVVNCLKEIGPTIIRWPGGNFAGEYRWKDGLLPSDMRAPLEAAMEDETQPYTHGYDYHEISTDDFVALCREVGAEPFLTINLVWNSPRDSADWVEYCNAPADTEYGRKRAENGHPEPYSVRFWSLGNEMGYSHMEGPLRPEDYAALASEHIREMKSADAGIRLFSSGPYPNEEWAANSAAALADSVKDISLHHYSNVRMDYTSPEKTAETYRKIVAEADKSLRVAKDMRACLDRTGKDLNISFDEWNFWYAWNRPSCVGEGIFTAKMLHILLKASGELDMPVCCYFQPVGEGAILITPTDAGLTANGQMFAMMKAHCGGRLCPTESEDGAALATVKGGVLNLTLINDSYDQDRAFRFAECGEVMDAILYSSKEAVPHTRFSVSELTVDAEDGLLRCALPPHSAAKISIKCRQ